MKSKILTILRSETNYISGEKISEDLGVSRTTIWKAIKDLRAQGYEIDSVTNKGYKLIKAPDILTANEIKPILKTHSLGKEIYDYKKVTSTNQLAKEKAGEGAMEGTVLIAEAQTAGRGRLGKQWDSPEGTGIWMSMILRPSVLPSEISSVTLLAGLAICKAIRKLTKLEAYIKWPNDIVVGGKKVCGILTEMSGEIDRVNYVILGIGINVNTQHMPEDLQQIATSLAIEGGKEYIRKDLVAELLMFFETYYTNYLKESSFASMRDAYKELCITLQNQVKVIDEAESYVATPVDIDKTGALIVDKEDGTRQTIVSGEVSVRGVYGYV